jgi:hypothetical protein
MLDTPSSQFWFWIIVISWLIVGVIWIGRLKSLTARLFKLIIKPVVFVKDKEPNNVPYYPRTALEFIVNQTKGKFAKNYIVRFLGLIAAFSVDIIFRVGYIIIALAQYFITAPILAVIYSFSYSSSMVQMSISGEESAAPVNKRINLLTSILSGLLGKYRPENPESLKLSVAYPNLLSKRLPSAIKVIIYPLRESGKLENIIKQEVENATITTYSGDTSLVAGNYVVIELSSQDIEFSKPVTKRLSDGINDISFTAKPKDTAFVGENKVKLSVTDKETNHEYVSLIFKIKIVDFVFDHISRPFLSQLASFILGLASVVTYTLTLIGKIDETLGLASGTTAAVIATFVYGRFYVSFIRSTEKINITGK